MEPSKSIVLVTVYEGDQIVSAGTGFVIAQQGSISTVLTCAHVAQPDPSATAMSIKVAGNPAEFAQSTVSQDSDLAVLLVKGLAGDATPLAMNQTPASRWECYCWGFTEFARGEYVKRRVKVRLKRKVQVQRAHSRQEIPYWEMSPAGKDLLHHGYSGAPVICVNQGRYEVVAVARTRSGDGTLGYAISVEALGREWPEVTKHTVSAKQRAQTIAEDVPPQDLPPIKHHDDPQKGRWGGRAARDGRRLRVHLIEESLYADSFSYDAFVESTDGSMIQGPARFHLHDSYPKSIIWVWKPETDNRIALERVTSTGIYTLGVQIKNAAGKWISLEYDLEKLRGLPKRFLSR